MHVRKHIGCHTAKPIGKGTVLGNDKLYNVNMNVKMFSAEIETLSKV